MAAIGYAPIEIEDRGSTLKTGSVFQRGKEVIQRNTDIVQAPNTVVCGHLCLYVLKALASGQSFQEILNGYPQSDRENSLQTEEGVRVT